MVAHQNPWLKKVRDYRLKHPELSYKEALIRLSNKKKSKGLKPTKQLEEKYFVKQQPIQKREPRLNSLVIDEIIDKARRDKMIKHKLYPKKKIQNTSKQHFNARVSHKPSKGLARDIVEGVKEGAKRIISFISKNYRDRFNSTGRAILDKFQGNFIKTIIVKRKPINKHLQLLMKVLTLGHLEQARKYLHYDNLYHLYTHLVLDNGVILQYEKQQTPILTYKLDKEKADSVSVNCNVRLDTFINNSINKMKSDYWTYNIQSNNCQRFIADSLSANKLYNESLKKFVEQDAKKLLIALHPAFKLVLDELMKVTTKSDILLKGNGKVRIIKYPDTVE